jgi:hypothetical protein
VCLLLFSSQFTVLQVSFTHSGSHFCHFLSAVNKHWWSVKRVCSVHTRVSAKHHHYTIWATNLSLVLRITNFAAKFNFEFATVTSGICCNHPKLSSHYHWNQTSKVTEVKTWKRKRTCQQLKTDFQFHESKQLEQVSWKLPQTTCTEAKAAEKQTIASPQFTSH